MKQSFKMAYGGILCGLSIVFMFLSSIFPFAEYAFPAIAGICLIPVVIEFGYKNAILCYVVVGMLSALIVPNKESVVLFIVFLGYYPILKGKVETMKNRILEWSIKILWFNLAVLFSYYVVIQILGMTQVLADFEVAKYGILLLLAVGNVVFIIYDIALTRLISMFLIQIRPKYIHKLK